jgi:hypothetical protein
MNTVVSMRKVIRLVAISLIAAATAGRLTPAAEAAEPIPASFFAVNPWNPDDYPKLKFGTLAHAAFSWPNIQPARHRVPDFAALDKFVADSPHLVDPATNTIHMVITLGLTPCWAVADPSKCTIPSNAPKMAATPLEGN